jgi:hypothetical protein
MRFIILVTAFIQKMQVFALFKPQCFAVALKSTFRFWEWLQLAVVHFFKDV